MLALARYTRQGDSCRASLIRLIGSAIGHRPFPMTACMFDNRIWLSLDEKISYVDPIGEHGSFGNGTFRLRHHVILRAFRS